MALTPEERKTIRAYNIGSFFSTNEPRLLEQIIKHNKNNDTVKTMIVAKEHREFNAGVPKKEFSREFKNGFHNARALCEHNPKLLDQMLTSPELNKDFKRGLASAKKEYELKQLNDKAKDEPQPVAPQYNPSFNRGFNQAYILSERHADVLKFTVDVEKKWGPYVQGLQAGMKQYEDDLKAGRVKPTPEKELSDTEYYKTQAKVEDLKENAEAKQYHMDLPEPGKEQQPAIEPKENRLPDWLKSKMGRKEDISPKTDKNLDKDIEPDK